MKKGQRPSGHWRTIKTRLGLLRKPINFHIPRKRYGMKMRVHYDGDRFIAAEGSGRAREWKRYSMDPMTFKQMSKVTKEQELVPLRKGQRMPNKDIFEMLEIEKV